MTAPLEGRYERLLRLYPPTYRRAHGADMLTTMLADAGSGQRWPRPGDAVNLIFHGLRLRLFKRPRGGFLDTGWADACALLGPLAALALLATRLPVALRMPPVAAVSTLDTHSIMGFSRITFSLQAAAWAVVAVVALIGLRRVAAPLAWLALLAEVVPLARLYDADPVPAVQTLYRPALALLAAVALTAAGPRRAAAILGRWRLVTILAAFAVLDTIAITNGPGTATDSIGEYGTYSVFHFGDLFGSDGTGGFSLESTSGTVLDALLVVLAVALLALAGAVLSVGGRLRRRLLVAAAPVVTLVLLIEWTLAGWTVSNQNMGHAIPLVAVQWLGLVGLPLLTLAVGLRWVRRRDDLLRLAALGATVEAAEPPEPTQPGTT
jgi:hypothetical protein